MIRHALILAALAFPMIRAEAQVAPAKQAADSLDGPPFVTCKAWAVADGKTGEVLWGLNEKASRPMASTTKIMTAWLVLSLAAQDAKVLEEALLVSERADKTGGSTADVRHGEKILIKDVLYGLLLPSGNDAATALAEHFGPRFAAKEADKDADSLTHFVAEMNRRAAALGMKETKYLDPHGIGSNQTSPRDLAKLAWTCMKDERFRTYVRTAEHRGTGVGPDGDKRAIVWKNTNQLLEIEGYDGIKTGTTGAAGACLVSSGHLKNDHLVIVVLGATSPDARYVDTRNLFRWAWLKRGHREK